MNLILNIGIGTEGEGVLRRIIGYVFYQCRAAIERDFCITTVALSLYVGELNVRCFHLPNPQWHANARYLLPEVNREMIFIYGFCIVLKNRGHGFVENNFMDKQPVMINQGIEIDMINANAAHGARYLRVLVGKSFLHR